MFTVVKHTYFKGVALKDLVPCATALLKFCRHLGSSDDSDSCDALTFIILL